MTGRSAWELFVLGGPFMWPLLGLSIVALGVTLDRLIVFATTLEPFEGFVRDVRAAATAGDWSEVQRRVDGRGGPLGRMCRCYVANRLLPRASRDELLQREGTLILERLEARLRWLGIVGQLAPMVGLAGTVLGLVVAFAQVESHGGSVQPTLLAGGIWQALLTTVAGLAVAIPSLMTFHLFEGRIDTLSRRMGLLVSYLDEWSGVLAGEPAAKDGGLARFGRVGSDEGASSTIE